MPLRLLTAPSGEAVSLEALKQQCAGLALDETQDDVLLGAYLAAAVGYLDGATGILGRALLTQQWALDLDTFPCRGIELPLSPVQTVDAVKYVDWAGVVQTINPSLYIAHLGEHPLVELAPDAAWPTHRRQSRAVSIEFTAGYGEAVDLPGPIVQALKLMVSDQYANRETGVVGTVAAEIKSSVTVHALLASFRTRFL